MSCGNIVGLQEFKKKMQLQDVKGISVYVVSVCYS